MHGSISTLSSSLQGMIDGVILFGDTRNKQDNGQIPKFPKSKTKIFCALLDVLCSGLDLISPTHFSYIFAVSDAVSFLKGVASL